MYNILTLNKISETGLCRFSDEYNCATDVANQMQFLFVQLQCTTWNSRTTLLLLPVLVLV